MGMKDTSLFDELNPTFIALTTTAIHHCLAAWITGVYRIPPEFGLGGGAHCKCNIRNINQAFNNACTDVFHHLNTDFHSSSPEVQAKKIDNTCSMIR